MRIRTLLLAASILVQSMLLAQNQVSVMPVIFPPYSIYLSDYQGSLMVSLVNQTNEPLEVKLVGSLTGDNGYSARTSSSSPASPILLDALASRIITGNTPEMSFIDLNNLQINAPEQIQNAVMQTGILPEGNYELCIQALDYYTNEELSMDAPIGCLFFSLGDPQPPMLTFPWCDSTVDTEWPVFTWSPPIGNINMTNIVYDLYILELLAGQSPNAAMSLAIDGLAGNPIIHRDLMIPAYPWMPYDLQLEVNTTYAVAVVARDITNMVMIENKGRSEVCTFKIETPSTSTGGGVLSAIDPSLTGFNPHVFDHLPIAPIKNTRIKGRLLYKFKESASEGCVDPKKEKGEDWHPPILFIPLFGTSTSAAGATEGATGSTSGSSGAGSGGAGGFMNANSMAAHDPLAGIVGSSNLGMNAYNFSGGASGSTSSPGLYGGPLVQGDISIESPFKVPEYKWKDPYPVSLTGGKSLKNITVQLIEEVIENGVVRRTNVIDTDETGEDGQFSLFYNQTITTGVDFPTLRVSEIDYDPRTDQVHTGGGKKLYVTSSVLRLKVVSPYYCSPDLEIYTQPGDEVELPTQVCYVRSYEMEVKVTGDACAYQFGGKDGALGNVEAKLMRPKHTPAAIPSDEGQDADELVLMPGLGNLPLVSRCNSNTGDGKVLFKNLVYHSNSSPDDYLLECSTSSEGGMNNYQAKKQYYPGNGSGGPVAVIYNDERAVQPYPRNSDFKVERHKVSMVLSPKAPRVFGRVMVSTAQSLPNARVELRLLYKRSGTGTAIYRNGCSGGWLEGLHEKEADTTMSRYVITDENGFFEFSNIMIKGANGGDQFLGPFATIFVTKPGYVTAIEPKKSPPVEELKMGVQWDMTIGIMMTPIGFVEGIVQNEEGQPIKCDVQVGDGPWGRTKTLIQLDGSITTTPGRGIMNPGITYGSSTERFSVRAPQGKDTVYLIPLSDQYFPLKVERTIPTNRTNTPTDLGVFTVKEKKHRLRVKLVDPDGKRISGAQVSVDDRVKTSNPSGVALFEFRSPETEYRLKVTAPGNYRPVNRIIVNYVTPDFITMEIELVPGIELAGKVTEMDGQPIADARVWVVMGSDHYGPQLNETTTNAQGEYLLSGVDYGYFTVYAAKYDPQISYIGASEPVGAPVTTPSVVPPYTSQTKLQYTILKLEREKNMDLTSIFGFPVEVTNRVKNSDGSYTLNGAFVKLPDNGNFKLEDPAQRVPFNQIKVRPGTFNAQGIPRAVPVDGAVKTDMTHLALKLFGDLDATLQGADETGFINPMHVGVRSGPTIIPRINVVSYQEGGVIRGKVGSELSSFNFSYNFTGRFYLGSTPQQPRIDVFRSGGSYPQRSFNLMTLSGGNMPSDAEFSLRGFKARSDRARSFVEPGVFRIATVLQITDIPDISPAMLELDAGEVLVKKETIEGIGGGGQKLSFRLNNWKFESTSPWRFDSGIASIVIPKGTLDMGLATAEVKQVLIRPNGMDMDVKNLSEVTIGGSVQVVPTPGIDWVFGYDKGYLYDSKLGAWRLGFNTAEKKDVATIQAPPELVPSKMGLSGFSMVSRGDPMAKLASRTYRYYNIADLTPALSFEATPDGMQMGMSCSMAIDGWTKTSTRFSLFKSNGKLVSQLAPMGTAIETGRGGVKFILLDIPTAQTFTPGTFTSYGKFLIPPQAGAEGAPGKSLEVKGMLHHSAAKTEIKFLEGVDSRGFSGDQKQEIRFGESPDKKMVLKEGLQAMVAGRWKELRFKGNLVGMEGIDDDPKNDLTFLVKGAVDLDEGEISVTKLSTPFGSLSMSYDFEKARLIGNLELKNCFFAAVNILEANLSLLVDKEGFLVSCYQSDIIVSAAPPPFQNHHPAFMIGAHGDIPQVFITQMMQGFRLQDLPSHLKADSGTKRHIHGLYLQNKLDLIDFSLPSLELVFVSIWGHARCSAEARIWVDMANGGSFGLGGMAYADVELGVGLLLPPCQIVLGAGASVLLEGKYEGEKFTIAFCSDVSAKISICGVGDTYNFGVKASVTSEPRLKLGLVDKCGGE